MTASSVVPILTLHGHLLLAPAADAPTLPHDVQLRFTDAFARGSGAGLLQLGAGEVGTALPAAFVYWREFAARYVTALCTSSEPAEGGSEVKPVPVAAPSMEDL